MMEVAPAFLLALSKKGYDLFTKIVKTVWNVPHPFLLRNRISPKHFDLSITLIKSLEFGLKNAGYENGNIVNAMRCNEAKS